MGGGAKPVSPALPSVIAVATSSRVESGLLGGGIVRAELSAYR